MLVILKYWQPILSATVSMVFAYLLHNVILNASLAAQESRLKAACAQAQSIAYEVSNEYQSNLSSLGGRLRDLDRVQPCIPIAPAPSGRDGTATGQGHVGPHGLNPKTLYDFAGDAERYRLQLVACQSFVRRVTDVRESN